MFRDTGTRDEGKPDYDTIAEFAATVKADGINGAVWPVWRWAIDVYHAILITSAASPHTHTHR